MRCTIFGLPSSGKGTLFTAVTGMVSDPGAMPQERKATVKVPDPRIVFLEQLYRPKKTTYATMELIDLPGFSLNDARGREDLARVLPTLRQSDVLAAVVRNFESSAVPPYKNRVNPQADVGELWDELCYADLLSVSNREEKIKTSMKKPTGQHDKEKRELALLEACKAVLEESRPLSSLPQAEEVAETLSSFGFLTLKPIVVVYNVGEDRAREAAGPTPGFACDAITLCAETEAQVGQLDPADRPAFLADLGVSEPAADRLIRACYQAAKQISFLTVGPDEVRAWPIEEGATAVEAAGKIHSDLARGFIRAETVAYDVIRTEGDFKGAKAAGKVRQEGKTYVVQDGDIINIKFNA